MLVKIAVILIALILPAGEPSPPVTISVPSPDSSLTIDGPYVLYRGDSVIVHYFDSVNDVSAVRTGQWHLSQKDSIRLVIQTDEPGRSFNVRLQPRLSPEKSTYAETKKMLVLSDIEGNFSALRKMLRGNGVIDSNYRWTFGKGHLVLLGDFVDRGTMVQEVLWLIYSLETQAAASGGKLHYMLGNHEIMNMTGDHRYVHPRYKAHAGLMQVPYLDLFGPQSELGRWLSTKNVTERIGRVLFIHSGFSAYMNDIELPLSAINDTARLYYFDTSTVAYPSPLVNLLFSNYGPFWYRNYYYGPPLATIGQIDSTLSLYNSRLIITGHTLIVKEISSFFDGKVINVDVPHYMGHSEALLFEGGKYYRVDTAGVKKKIAPAAVSAANTAPEY